MNKTPWLRGQQNGTGSPAQTFNIDALAVLKRNTYRSDEKLNLLATLRKQLGVSATYSFVTGK